MPSEPPKSEPAEPRRLPEAPDHPFDADGSPAYGTYRNELTTLSLDSLARDLLGRVGALRAVKRWQWFGVFDDGIAMGAAIVSMGYASNIFGWVFDRRSKTFRWERQSNGLPGRVSVAATPRPGSTSSASGLLNITRVTDATWRLQANWRELSLDIDARSIGAAMTAICPVDGIEGGLHTTRKAAGLAASGRIEWNGGSHRLGPEAFLLLDHSHGITSRRTSWRWVMAHGKELGGGPVSLNAVSGFNAGLENVAWIDGEPVALGKVDIAFHPDEPSRPWALYNDRLDLELQVEGVRSHNVHLGLVASQYDQPIGVWRGHVMGRDVELVGVAEDHRALW